MILYPEKVSALRSEAAMAAAASSISITIPFLMPWEGEMPTPTTCTRLALFTSPISALTFEVPTSRPTTICSPAILSLARPQPLPSSEPGDEMTPNDGQVVEYPCTKGHDSGKVELHAQPVAQEGQGPCQQHVGKEPRHEDVILVFAVQFGSNRP